MGSNAARWINEELGGTGKVALVVQDNVDVFRREPRLVLLFDDYRRYYPFFYETTAGQYET